MIQKYEIFNLNKLYKVKKQFGFFSISLIFKIFKIAIIISFQFKMDENLYLDRLFKDDITLLKSSQGKKSAIYRGYYYKFHRSTKTSSF